MISGCRPRTPACRQKRRPMRVNPSALEGCRKGLRKGAGGGKLRFRKGRKGCRESPRICAQVHGCACA
jgi:hypothetical protein